MFDKYNKLKDFLLALHKVYSNKLIKLKHGLVDEQILLMDRCELKH